MLQLGCCCMRLNDPVVAATRRQRQRSHYNPPLPLISSSQLYCLCIFLVYIARTRVCVFVSAQIDVSVIVVGKLLLSSSDLITVVIVSSCSVICWCLNFPFSSSFIIFISLASSFFHSILPFLSQQFQPSRRLTFPFHIFYNGMSYLCTYTNTIVCIFILISTEYQASQPKQCNNTIEGAIS